MDWFALAERGTAMVWVALAFLGIFRRVRRLEQLSQIILPAPIEREDVDYLASVKQSTYLRLGVKVVMLIGGLIALLHVSEYLLLWRMGIIVSLVLMDAETANVDAVRQRIALRARAMSAAQAQTDRMEATGVDTNDRLRRGEIGRGGAAIVDREQVNEIQAASEETVGRLRREGIGEEERTG